MSDPIFEAFERYERDVLCEKARAGMTREQMTGAGIFWEWYKKHLAANQIVAAPNAPYGVLFSRSPVPIIHGTAQTVANVDGQAAVNNS